jgi:hypothetical protein
MSGHYDESPYSSRCIADRLATRHVLRNLLNSSLSLARAWCTARLGGANSLIVRGVPVAWWRLESSFRKAKVPRCVGQGSNYHVQEFAVFCPKAFASIGRLPDTISDRCIPIQLIRRSRDEKIERFCKRDADLRRFRFAKAWQPGCTKPT